MHNKFKHALLLVAFLLLTFNNHCTPGGGLIVSPGADAGLSPAGSAADNSDITTETPDPASSDSSQPAGVPEPTSLEGTPLFIPPTVAKLMSGNIQKGPFIKGSMIQVQELNDLFEPIGTYFTLFTNDDLGTFKLSSTITQNYIELIGFGFYFNEISNEISPAPLTLRVFSDITEDRDVMINPLTTLDRERIEYLLRNPGDITVTSESNVFNNARKQAETEILQDIFNINEAEVCSFDKMTISEEGVSNAILLAVSLVLQGSNSVGKLSELISSISFDLKRDGVLDNEAIREQLVSSAACLNPSTIRANLEARYEYVGALDAVVPRFEDYIDSDGDGNINLFDETPPTVVTLEPEDGQTEVLVSTTIQASFSEHMDGGLITPESFRLLTDDTEIEGAVSYDCKTKTASFLPGQYLDEDTTYTAEITGTLIDGAGNPIDRAYTWSFTTTAEECNNIDDDDDGEVDEDLTRPTACGVGACEGNTGIETCTKGQWGNNTCDPHAGTSTEVCDGLDNDCDGTPDNGILGTTRPTTCGVGICAANTGTQTCAVVNGGTETQWTGDTCNPLAKMATEECDGVDNDCDGYTDEGLGTPGVQCGIGACQRSGTKSCTEGAWVENCTAGTPQAEVCDHLDNDCDGQTNEGVLKTYYRDEDKDGFGTTSSRMICGPGLDATGDPANGDAQYYTATQSGDCSDNPNNSTDFKKAAQRYPGNTEVCDYVDNNCDGATDEGLLQTYYYDQDQDSYGTDKDRYTAAYLPPKQLCPPEVPNRPYNSSYYTATNYSDCKDTAATTNPGAAELCDNADNDCDGVVDNGVTNTERDVTCGKGACAGNTGKERCVAGTWGNSTCNATAGANAETCNNIDDDCDGSTDDGLTTTNSSVSCGLGQCKRYEQTQCVDGALVTACTQGTPTTEACDYTDNDCDGVTDEFGDVPLGLRTKFYYDEDGDGYGQTQRFYMLCLAGDYAKYTNSSSSTFCYTGASTPEQYIAQCDAAGWPGVRYTGSYQSYTGTTYFRSVSPGDCKDNYTSSSEKCGTISVYENRRYINPGAPELCNDQCDNNCDGSTDEGC
ncbi:MAG: Ig-like domain-containing protein [Deltaproteobacteria bacterium]|nr:Ig-like domain-containing protein [Deltaproteobacteria bacterium]